VIKKIVSSLR